MAAGSMRRATKERLDRLLTLLRQGVDGVDALAVEVGVSPSTVRRDLDRLQEEGAIARTYGGALVREVFHERSFRESARLHQEAKRAIGRAAASMATPGATVFVDAGSTCLALARALVPRAPLTVVTRGLETALHLANEPEVDVVMLGGTVQPLSHGVVGPGASLGLDRLTFDVAFLGADAVDPVRGLGEPTAEEAYVKERAALRASSVVLLADRSKLEPANLPAWTPFEAGWTLVTDGASGDVVAAFEERGVRLVVAG